MVRFARSGDNGFSGCLCLQLQKILVKLEEQRRIVDGLHIQCIIMGHMTARPEGCFNNGRVQACF